MLGYDRTMWMGAGAVLVGLATLLLAGCAAPDPDPRPTATDTVAGAIQMPDGVVVATGSFLDGVGHVTGDVTITSAGGYDFSLSITGFSSSVDTYDLSAIGRPVSEGERCFTEPWQLTWGTPRGETIEEVISRENPSFIDAIVVTTLPVESSEDCALEYVGYANLEWDIPDLWPDLVVTDSGPVEKAQGAVVAGEDGRHVSYEVAKDDVLARIAERLGVTEEQLEYLNPTADWTGSFIQVGEILNLSKDDR
jgi:hypothetical protein